MGEKKNLTSKETFTLAVQNHQKNNLQVAENLYNETLKTNPNHVDAYYNLENSKKQKVVLKKQSKLILVMQLHIIILD